MAPARVLTVDDEEPVRRFISRTLSESGYDVMEAADAREALEIAQQQGPFDLCVIDLAANEAHLDKPVGVKALREAVSLLLYGRISPDG